MKLRKCFSNDEDLAIIKLVSIHGQNWKEISACLGNRTGKQIRDRYINHLDPSINHAQWTESEDEFLISTYNELGPLWTLISEKLPGRPENMIKNRFHSYLKKEFPEKLFSSRSQLDDNNSVCSLEESMPPFTQESQKKSKSHDPILIAPSQRNEGNESEDNLMSNPTFPNKFNFNISGNDPNLMKNGSQYPALVENQGRFPVNSLNLPSGGVNSLQNFQGFPSYSQKVMLESTIASLKLLKFHNEQLGVYLQNEIAVATQKYQILLANFKGNESKK